MHHSLNTKKNVVQCNENATIHFNFPNGVKGKRGDNWLTQTRPARYNTNQLKLHNYASGPVVNTMLFNRGNPGSIPIDPTTHQRKKKPKTWKISELRCRHYKVIKQLVRYAFTWTGSDVFGFDVFGLQCQILLTLLASGFNYVRLWRIRVSNFNPLESSVAYLAYMSYHRSDWLTTL